MKKFMSLIMSLLLVLSFCACSVVETAPATTMPAATTEIVTEAATSPTGETTIPSTEDTTAPTEEIDLAGTYGIDLSYVYDIEALTLTVTLTWTNTTDEAAAYDAVYTLDVIQNDTVIAPADATALSASVEPGSNVTVELVYTLTDASAVNINIGDSVPNGYFSTATVDLAANG